MAPFEEFTSHQLDLRRPTVHANLALKSEQSAHVTLGHLSSGAYYLESSKPAHLLYFQPLLFSCCVPYGVAARDTVHFKSHHPTFVKRNIVLGEFKQNKQLLMKP